MTILEKINTPSKLTISRSDFDRLEETYIYRNKRQVQQFLRNNAELVKFLVDSREPLRKYFGAETTYFLEVIKDPEASIILETLFVNIRTTMSAEDALNRLDELDRNWYFDNFDWLGGVLNFSLELQ